jgi:hypothetical protein
MWCPWCGERIILGVVTPGGIVYHAACWRKREKMLRRNAEQRLTVTFRLDG